MTSGSYESIRYRRDQKPSTCCLDSIAAAFVHAAPLDAEIVVVDNGSTDDTAEIINAQASASGVLVKPVLEPRLGKGRALNCALRAAEGELVAFIDDDCRLHPEYINDLLRHNAADTNLVLRRLLLLTRLRSIPTASATTGRLRTSID
jgi:glycosyltransferase involved in cell wall biosynthesis